MQRIFKHGDMQTLILLQVKKWAVWYGVYFHVTIYGNYRLKTSVFLLILCIIILYTCTHTKLCLFMHYIHIGLAPKYLSDCVSTVSAASGRYRLRSTGLRSAKNKNKIRWMWLLLLRSSHLEHSSIQPSWHYWYEYIPKPTQECTFWLCLQLTIAGAPGRVV